MTETLEPLPPREAIEAFRRKGYEITFDWRDMMHEEHSRGFTVAKVASLDILHDIRAAVDRAISQGDTFEQFRREITPELQRRGWWGRSEMTDPLTGERREVQLGSPRRLRVIYDTNLRMAHAAGRWEGIERTAQARPWLRYVAILDDRTRDEHRDWHDTILRWDDPWWNQHNPPNGWNCRCTVQQLSDADLRRRGFTPSGGGPDVPTREWRNRRTGEVTRIPQGIDPGFSYNVGRANMAHLRRVATDRLDGADEDIARAGIDSMVRSGAFTSFLRSPGQAPGFPVAAGATRLGAARPTLELPPQTVARQRADGSLPAPEAWGRVQHLVDRGTATTEGRVRRVRIDGEPWEMEVEPGEDGRMRVLSLRRAGRS